MSRDPRKLRVFALADTLVLEIYRVTASFPIEERYGLQAQVRRAAVSTATNIVEGCARRTTGEYVQLLSVATGSAAETEYLLSVAWRLGILTREVHTRLGSRYSELLKGLQALINSFEPELSLRARGRVRRPKPEV